MFVHPRRGRRNNIHNMGSSSCLVCQTGSKSVFEGEAQSVPVHVYPSRQSSLVEEEMHAAENTNKIVCTS